MRLARLLVMVWVWGVALVQAGCSCGDLPVTYGFQGSTRGDFCQDDAECPGGVCRNGVCYVEPSRPPASPTPPVPPPCTDDAQCSAGNACREGTCIPDTFAPRVVTAFLPGSAVLRVRFSEPMLRDDSAEGLLNPDNYCVELTDDTPEVCTPSDAFWMGSVLSSDDARSVDIQLPYAPGGGRYTVQVTNVVDRAGHKVVSPRHADFEVGGPLRLVGASSLGPSRVLLTFSRPVVPGPDVSGSAGCTSPATCASRYRLVGASSLGAILSAEVRPAPHDNEVLLTHEAPQSGGLYTVLAANGLVGDGLEDASTDSIAAAEGGGRLGPQPLDRVTFTGSGPARSSFGDGPVQVDPFGDGVTLTSVIPYRGRVYAGLNGNGTRAVGMDLDGLRPEDLSFRFRKDLQKSGGSSSSNTAGAPFPSIGFAGCQGYTHGCGPDNENGRALFASGTLDGTEWLMMGGTQHGGPGGVGRGDGGRGRQPRGGAGDALLVGGRASGVRAGVVGARA